MAKNVARDIGRTTYNLQALYHSPVPVVAVSTSLCLFSDFLDTWRFGVGQNSSLHSVFLRQNLVCLFVCLLGIASPQVGQPGPSDFVDRSLTLGKDQCSLSLRTHECRADFLTLRICRPATPLILCFSSVHLQTQLRRVSDRCGDADDAGKQWSNQDE